MTLTEFLLARIAEDEAVAREATPGPWRDTPMGSEGSIVQAGGFTITTARKPATCREFPDAAHIARHDPARVLAECEAKRQIVRAHIEQREHSKALAENPTVPEVVLTHAALGMALAELSVRHLATIHADHPDFRDEWKP